MKVITADCIEAMADMDEASVDAIVTDPPYGLGFMGKQWDDLPPGPEFAEQALRVLKPGGHLAAFGGSRTYHRLTVAIEDAGFEIRDCLMWLYGSGFPKSHDVSKAIDREAGVKRKVTGYEIATIAPGSGNYVGGPRVTVPIADEPATDAAREWEGWGTALKPAHEPIVLARKPLEGTVAENVQKWGTGGLNIDGCRIGFASEADRTESTAKNQHEDFGTSPMTGNVTYGDYSMVKPRNYDPPGRWPANLAFDETAATMLDEQSGEMKSGTAIRRNLPEQGARQSINLKAPTQRSEDMGYGDTGGASRFFYCAKASKSERNAGLDNFQGKAIAGKGNGLARSCATCGASVLDGCECPDRTYENPTRANHHPTVKPVSLMRWLVRLVTPPNGIVLDPFTGSGTTGIAAALEGFDFIGIEREAEYAEIARARIEHWHKQPKQEALL